MAPPTRNEALVQLELDEPLPANVVRRYAGYERDEAQLKLDHEAPLFALLGYRLAMVSWAPRRGRELLMGVLRLILFAGLCALPDTFTPGRSGSLTVTYVQP
jgi:hypothetical protein